MRITKLRDLDLQRASRPGRPDFLSAASGLVRVGGSLYVVSDDELHLGRFRGSGDAPGELVRLMPGRLPLPKKARKKRKPDLEILLRLPAMPGVSGGGLLALGSGSGKNRHRGAWLRLDARGRISGSPAPVDASDFFARLAQDFDDLNLEGGWFRGRTLNLLQRGNRGGSPNAVIGLDGRPVLAALARGEPLPALAPVSIEEKQLGSRAGVPLCFSDASMLPDGSWAFSAVAEDMDNSFADGPCVAAAVGMADGRNRLLWLRDIDRRYKIEGIDARKARGKLRLLLVTDADDAAVPACLLEAVVD